MSWVVDHGGAAAWLGLAGTWPAQFDRADGSIVGELLDSVADVCWLLRQPARPIDVSFDVELAHRAFERFPASALYSRALELRQQFDSIESALSLALAEVLRVPLITLDASLAASGLDNVVLAR